MSSYCHSTLAGIDSGREPVTSPPLAPRQSSGSLLAAATRVPDEARLCRLFSPGRAWLLGARAKPFPEAHRSPWLSTAPRLLQRALNPRFVVVAASEPARKDTVEAPLASDDQERPGVTRNRFGLKQVPCVIVRSGYGRVTFSTSTVHDCVDRSIERDQQGRINL